MDLQTIAFIATGVLSILTAFLGVGYAKFKSAFKESADVVVVIVKAYEDDKVSSEELEEIIKEVKEAGGAWKNVFTK